jgi:hypothetical protein
MNKYPRNIHFPLEEQFVAGGKIYTKMSQNDTHCLYEVKDPNNGDPYSFYEIFQLREYHPKGIFKSSILKEGDYYYPTNEDFGVWAFCYSKKEKALDAWNRINK